MHRWFGFLVAICIAAPPTVVRANSFPITAYLQQPAQIHSGPGEQFYATQTLAVGDAVEIYKTTDDGWCGIRPLPDSFSLVPEDAIQSSEAPGIAIVMREGLRTRVGSHLGNEQHVKYVTLNKGESVRSLGLAETPGWLKIAPPAGEFRWIHRRFLGSEKPSNTHAVEIHESVAQVSFDDVAQTQKRQLDLDGAPVGTSVRQSLVQSQLENSDPQGISGELVASAKPLSGMSTTPIESVNPPEPIVQPIAARTQSAAPDSTWTVRSDSRSVHEPLQQANDFHAELQQINVALTQVVVQETSKWDLTDVRRSAERIVDSAQKQDDRQAARELLRRIAEFESLQRRHDGLATPQSGRDISPEQFVAASRRRAEQRSNARRSTQPAVDDNVELASFLQANNRSQRNEPVANGPGANTHEGWLMPVVTANLNLPKYAITDNDGKILSFVSGGTGVNLQRYVRQYVTLQGESGFNQTLNKNHLVATRVVTAR
ncbi:MAG: hypothetical protein KDB27_03600 [Planctomycetales bacterium]|nr:hypothetical protein [Planctomycetales bacterium]